MGIYEVKRGNYSFPFKIKYCIMHKFVEIAIIISENIAKHNIESAKKYLSDIKV